MLVHRVTDILFTLRQHVGIASTVMLDILATSKNLQDTITTNVQELQITAIEDESSLRLAEMTEQVKKKVEINTRLSLEKLSRGKNDLTLLNKLDELLRQQADELSSLGVVSQKSINFR
jgi:hypothetical protein